MIKLKLIKNDNKKKLKILILILINRKKKYLFNNIFIYLRLINNFIKV